MKGSMNGKRKDQLLIVGIIFIGVTLISIPGTFSQGTKSPIKIGIMYPFTGPEAFLGKRQLRGWEIALEKRNYKVGDREIKTIVEDDIFPATVFFVVERAVAEQAIKVSMYRVTLTADGMFLPVQVVCCPDNAPDVFSTIFVKHLDSLRPPILIIFGRPICRWYLIAVESCKPFTPISYITISTAPISDSTIYKTI